MVDRKKKHTKTAAEKTCPLVGIGASAGGLEAVTQFLKHLPGDTGMAFVLVQHLDPSHESALTQLLARATKMTVMEARNNVRPVPNCFYVIPPDKIIMYSGGRLKLAPRQEGKDDRMPVDHFFQSLAGEQNENFIGIVLSGNGADGTAGLQALKAAGGTAIVQDQATAKFPAMPANAVAAGCADFVLPPAKMGAELARLSQCLKHPPILSTPTGETMADDDRAFEEILVLLRQRMTVDFHHYKQATLRRRLHRRMMLHKLSSIREYYGFLRSHAAEIKELFNDILIHVTGFFRDPEMFRALRKKLLPRILQPKAAEETIRVWVAGCSTGEEAYSLAMTLAELMTDRKLHHPVQIFGTDISESALERARTGLYPESIQTEVSPERLRRFFSRCDGGYRVNKIIREMCIFARQNLANDPPFSNQDLISCRNVLIYLSPGLQRKVLPMFHYALRPTGLLMLGASETIGSFSDLFTLADKKAKAYSKKPVQTPSLSFSHGLPRFNSKSDEADHPAEVAFSIPDIQKQADRIVLTGYSPAGVIINCNLEVLQFRGRTGPYLEHPHGEANFNLLKMAREGLLLDLRSTIAKAMKHNIRVRHEHVRVQQNHHSLECSIEVIPFSVPPAQEKFYLVLFESQAVTVHGAKKGGGDKIHKLGERQLVQLREELAATRDSLQSIIEEQEATNEELRAANEEITSSNEELQSTNEELETAKEELQSTNEELTTLNDELESRNGELELVNNDLHNLLGSVSIPVIILNADLRIRRFTAMAEKMFKLIPGDIGRPITDINLPLDPAHLEKQVHEVLDSLAPKDWEVQDRKGHWWSVRIRAYKTTEQKIDGVVIAWMDIHLLKMNMGEMRLGRDLAEAIVDTIREPLLVLDENLTVKSTNKAFYRKFKTRPEDTLGRRIYDLGDQQWNIPPLRVLLEETLKKNQRFSDFEVTCDFPKIGKKTMLLNARRLKPDHDNGELILLALEEK